MQKNQSSNHNLIWLIIGAVAVIGFFVKQSRTSSRHDAWRLDQDAQMQRFIDDITVRPAPEPIRVRVELDDKRYRP